jgi:hypothetical protein
VTGNGWHDHAPATTSLRRGDDGRGQFRQFLKITAIYQKKEYIMKIFKVLILPIVCGTLAVAAPVYAADTAANTNMQILLDKVKADKKLVVAANMDLSDAESKAFWPIYDAYQKDLMKLNGRLVKTIASYADAYNSGAMTDQQAQPLIDETLAIEASEAAMRKSYAAKLGKVLPAKKVARYLQIENKIRALIRFEMADKIPLVP